MNLIMMRRWQLFDIKILKFVFNLFNKDLTGRTWQVESFHPYFGEMTLFAFKNNANSYWEAGIDFEGDYVSVCIEAPDKSMPSESQIAFARNIVAEPDKVFARLAPLIKLEFEKWHKKSMPLEWRAALKFVNFTIPIDADETNQWELSYESLWDSDGHVFTCCFKDGQAAYISVDG